MLDESDAPEPTRRKLPKNHREAKQVGQRLFRMIAQRGWTQAEFAKQAQARAPEGMRIGADSVSHYVHGRYLPSPSHMKILNEVLGTELMPDLVAPSSDDAMPGIRVRDHEGAARLEIDLAVPWPVALKVLSVLKGE